MQSVIKLSVVMLNVVMLSVPVPSSKTIGGFVEHLKAGLLNIVSSS